MREHGWSFSVFLAWRKEERLNKSILPSFFILSLRIAPPNKSFMNLQFLHKLGCKIIYWDHARLSSLANKQVDQNNYYFQTNKVVYTYSKYLNISCNKIHCHLSHTIHFQWTRTYLRNSDRKTSCSLSKIIGGQLNLSLLDWSDSWIENDL